MTLTEFLLARIAEDEAAAKAANERISRVSVPIRWGVVGERLYVGDAISLGIAAPLGDHIARHDPARVLAECEAKRRIVANHAHSADSFYPELDGGPVTFMDCDVCCEASPYRERGGWCLTLRLLALPDADHPDYDPSWRAS